MSILKQKKNSFSENIFTFKHYVCIVKKMINTYNENLIHKELKMQYAASYNGKIEQKIGAYICDIYSEQDGIFEIQTSNLFKLKFLFTKNL